MKSYTTATFTRAIAKFKKKLVIKLDTSTYFSGESLYQKSSSRLKQIVMWLARMAGVKLANET